MLSAMVLKVCLIIVTIVGYTIGSTAKVFILSGQSNMVGLGIPCELSGTDIKNGGTFNNIVVYSALPAGELDEPEVLKAPLNHWTTFGPEIGIGEVLSEFYKNDTIYFIKAAWGGTDLHDEWLENTNVKIYQNGVLVGYYDYTLFSWFLRHVRTALQQIKTNHGDYNIKGMFWLQGESDACNTHMANEYKDNLKLFVEKVRDSLDAPNMPFVYGKIQNWYLNGEYTWQLGAEVQAHQESAGNEIVNALCVSECANSQASMFPYSYKDTTTVFYCGGNAYRPQDGYNQVHYSTGGNVYIGREFGKAMRRKLVSSAPIMLLLNR